MSTTTLVVLFGCFYLISRKVDKLSEKVDDLLDIFKTETIAEHYARTQGSDLE